MSDAILKVGALGANESTFTSLPDPSEWQALIQDIDNSSSGRSASGKMLRDRIAGGATAKRKLECVWNSIDSDKVSQILQAVSAEFFQVKYPDPYMGTDRTAIFYVGDRSAAMYAYKFLDNGTKHMYKTLKFNFIEE